METLSIRPILAWVQSKASFSRTSIVACTLWKTKEDAIAYEAGGTAKEVVAKVKAFFAGPPTLRSYRVRR